MVTLAAARLCQLIKIGLHSVADLIGRDSCICCVQTQRHALASRLQHAVHSVAALHHKQDTSRHVASYTRCCCCCCSFCLQEHAGHAACKLVLKCRGAALHELRQLQRVQVFTAKPHCSITQGSTSNSNRRGRPRKIWTNIVLLILTVEQQLSLP